jgi:diguanylate cyclase (GGDEF)-like protein/PAS domain S-box-containing protein
MDTRQLAEQIIHFGGGEEPRIKNAKGELRRVKPATRNMGAFLLSSETQDVSTLNSDTSLKSATEGLSTQRERIQFTIDSIGDGVASTDGSGRINYLNRKAEELTGWSLNDAMGRPASEVLRILDANSREAVRDYLERAAQQNRTLYLPADCVLIRRDRSEFPVEDSVAPIHDREAHTVGAVIVFRDVSAAQAVRREITRSAEYDFLTGLPNRMLLDDRVAQGIAMASRHTKRLAVLFMDLNGFKSINDSLGHTTGDKLLQSISQRLLNCVRASDTVSRHGGDEFVVLLTELEGPDGAAIIAKKLLNAVARPHSIDDQALCVTASIGVSVYPQDGLDAETLFSNADIAMYQAKKSPMGHGYHFFDPVVDAFPRRKTHKI